MLLIDELFSTTFAPAARCVLSYFWTLTIVVGTGIFQALVGRLQNCMKLRIYTLRIRSNQEEGWGTRIFRQKKTIIFSPKRLDRRSNAIPCYSESVREMIETGPLANTSCQSWLFGYSPEYFFITTRFWVTHYNHLYVYWMHGPLESDLVKLKKWFVVESKCTGVAVAIKPNRIWNGCAFLWTVFGNIVI